MITVEQVYAAQEALKHDALLTPIVNAEKLTDVCHMYLKAENLQRTGSFKIRGAFNKISQLNPATTKGVIACSAGNHAQGVAYSAKKFGIKAVICMPSSAPQMKIDATRSYGAEVVLVDGCYDDSHARAVQLQEEYGYTFIHPFDDDDVIAGQATIGLEILSQFPDTEAVVVPIGGGGLISGISFIIKQLKPECKVYGVQTTASPAMYASVANGDITAIRAKSTFADGIAVKVPGSHTLEYCKKYVDDIVTVSDPEIGHAIARIIETSKLVSEGAGAVGVAAVLANRLSVEGKKTVCVVSGGNIDTSVLIKAIQLGQDGLTH